MNKCFCKKKLGLGWNWGQFCIKIVAFESFIVLITHKLKLKIDILSVGIEK